MPLRGRSADTISRQFYGETVQSDWVDGCDMSLTHTILFAHATADTPQFLDTIRLKIDLQHAHTETDRHESSMRFDPIHT